LKQFPGNVNTFLCVLQNMDEKILNYLIVGHLEDEDFESHPHLRVRSAYILAKKEYLNMSKKEKEIILKIISDEEQDQ